MELDFGPYRERAQAQQMSPESAERIRKRLREECAKQTAEIEQDRPSPIIQPQLNKASVCPHRIIIKLALPIAACLVFALCLGLASPFSRPSEHFSNYEAIASAPKLPFNRIELDNPFGLLKSTDRGVRYAIQAELVTPIDLSNDFTIRWRGDGDVSIFRSDVDSMEALGSQGNPDEIEFSGGEPARLFLAITSDIPPSRFDPYDTETLDLNLIAASVDLVQQLAGGTFVICTSNGEEHHLTVDISDFDTERELRNVFRMAPYRKPVFQLIREA